MKKIISPKGALVSNDYQYNGYHVHWLLTPGQQCFHCHHISIAQRGISGGSSTYHDWLEIQIQISHYLTYQDIGHNVFKKCDWIKFPCDYKEVILINASEHRGNKVDIHMFVDSDHGAIGNLSDQVVVYWYMSTLSVTLFKEIIYSKDTSIWCWVCDHKQVHRCLKGLKE